MPRYRITFTKTTSKTAAREVDLPSEDIAAIRAWATLHYASGHRVPGSDRLASYDWRDGPEGEIEIGIEILPDDPDFAEVEPPAFKPEPAAPVEVI